ncbi:MAG: hypothetical protein WA775_16150 [Psychroserpens sp.]|uniref:hypothetical protein n=1 Tax=Psychroserpens sp. TaxID=2020870 RepID=UPI003C714BF4
MRSRLLLVLCMVTSLNAFSQIEQPDDPRNGVYHLLEPERGLNNQPTSTKLVQYGKNNGTKLLAIAACEKCMPAVYTFQPEETEILGVTTHYNSTGLFVFEYDSESFVIIMLDPSANGDWTNFMFSNFYSKDQEKVNNMSKDKIKDFVTKISE